MLKEILNEGKKTKGALLGVIILFVMLMGLVVNKIIYSNKYDNKIKISTVEVTKYASKNEAETGENTIKGYDTIIYKINYMLETEDKKEISDRTAIVEATLSNDDIKYASWNNVEEENITSEIINSGKTLRLTITNVTTNKQYSLNAKLNIVGAPDGFSVSPEIKVEEKTTPTDEIVKPTTQVVKTKSISGKVVNKQTGNVENNVELQICKIDAGTCDDKKTTYTKEDGSYSFSDLQNGKYQIKIVDEVSYALVKEIEEVTIIDESITLNIEIANQTKFRASIKKYVRKVIVTENGQEKAYNYGKIDKALVAVKNIKNADIKIIYEFEIKNETEKEGYVKVIKENIPEGLEYDSNYEENKGWEEIDGVLYNKTLSNETIKANETKIVTIALKTKDTTAAKNYLNKVSITGENYYTVKYVVNNEVVKELSVIDSDKIDDYKYEKEGYEFIGWYTDKEYKNKYDFNSVVEDDLVLYGKVNSITKMCKFTYLRQNGTIFKKTELECGSKADDIDGPTDEEGYDFKCWLDTTKEDTCFDFEKEIEEDTEVTADMQKHKYNVTFIDEGKSYKDGKYDQKVEYQLKAEEPNDKPTKEGSVFKGWTLDGELYNFDTPVVKDIVLVSSYNIDKHDVIFIDEKMGTDDNIYAINKEVEYLSKIERPGTDPSHEGYEFIGWYKQNAITSFDFEIEQMPNTNLTLYAKYNTKKYPVIFRDTQENGGGSYDEYNQEVEYDKTAEEPNPDPEKDCLTFKYWSLYQTGKDSEGKEAPFDFINEKIKGETILYAIFEPKEVTVTYVDQGKEIEKEEVDTITCGQIITPSDICEKGDNCDKPDYEFECWRDADDPAVCLPKNTPVTKNITLVSSYIKLPTPEISHVPTEWTKENVTVSMNFPTNAKKIRSISKKTTDETGLITYSEEEITTEEDFILTNDKYDIRYQIVSEKEYTDESKEFEPYTLLDEWNSYTQSFIQEKNAIVVGKVVVKNTNESSENLEHEIINIDKKAPNMNNNNTPQETSILLTGTVVDNQSLPNKVEIYYIEGSNVDIVEFLNDDSKKDLINVLTYEFENKTLSTQNYSTTLNNLTEDTTYTVGIVAYDVAGNKTNMDIKDITTISDDEDIIVAQIIGRNGTLYENEDEYEPFSSLEKARQSCGDTTDICTIQMVLSTNESVEIGSNQNITLDLNGKIVSGVIGGYTIRNNGKFTVIDSAEEAGKIENTNEEGLAIDNINTATLILGVNEEPQDVSITKPNIVGTKFGIQNSTTSLLNFYDGRVEGNVAISGEVYETPYLYNVNVSVAGTQVATLTILAEAEARVNTSKYYTKIANAIIETENGYYEEDSTSGESVPVLNSEVDTVEMLKNITLTESLEIEETRNVILDLNGQTLTTSSTDYVLKNNGSLKIIDSIDESDTSGLTGSVTGTTSSVIYNNTNANLIIDEGTINVNKKGTSSNYANGITNYGTITLNENATINDDQYYSSAIDNKETGQILHSTGTINITGTTSSTAVAIRNYSQIQEKISGLNISLSNSSKSGIIHYADHMLTIDDVTITSGKAITLLSTNVLNLEYNSLSGSVINNNTSGTININGGTFLAAVSNNNKGTININGGTFSKSVSNNSTGTLNLNDGTIISSYSEFQKYDEGTLVNTSKGTININGGTISSTNRYSIGNTSTGTVNIGVKDGVVSNEYPKIESNIISIPSSTGIINWYDGVVIGQKDNAILEEINDSEKDYDLLITDESEELERITLAIPTEEVFGEVAKIDDETYPSIQSAINALPDNDQKTIILLKDVRTIINNTISENKNAILDLGSHQIKIINSEYLISNKGTLKITDSTNELDENGNITMANLLTNLSGNTIENSGNLEIDGVQVTTGSSTAIKNINEGLLTMTDGEINCLKSYCIGIDNESTNKMIVNGGTIKSSDNYAIKNTTTGSIDISGGTISTHYNDAIYNGSTGTINVTGGTISIESGSGDYTIRNVTTGTVNISGGTISSTKGSSTFLTSALYNSKGTINMTGGTIESTEGSYAVYNNSTGIINILKGNISSEVTAIHNSSTGTINIGEKGDLNEDGTLNVSKENPSISSKKRAVYNNSSGILNFYDGIIKGATAISGNLTEVEDGYDVITDSDEEYSEIKYLDILPIVKVLSTGEEYYSLQEAVDAITVESDTLQILRDLTISSSIDISQDKNIILDINGKKIAVTNSLFISNKGTLKLEDSTSEIDENGNITTTEGSIESTSGNIIENSGNLEINGVQVTTYSSVAIKNVNEGTLVMTSGRIYSDKGYGIYNTSTSQVILNGGRLYFIESTLGEIIINKNAYVAGVDIAGGTATVDGGTISGSIKTSNSGTININDGTMNGTIKNDDTGIININGGTISGSSTAMIKNNGTGTINMYDGTITNSYSEYRDYYYTIGNLSSGTINITGGVINSKINTILNNSAGIVNIGIKNDLNEGGILNISKESPSISSENIAVQNNDEGILNFYDGIIKGTTAISGPLIDIEDSYNAILDLEDGLEVVYLDKLPLAKVSSTGEEYYSLQEAIDAITTEGDTVQVLENVIFSSISETVSVSEIKNIILDMNGKKIVTSNSLFISNAGTLKLEDSTNELDEEGNTTVNNSIISTSGDTVENSGNIEIDGAKLESIAPSATTVKNINNGVLTVTSGEVNCSNEYCKAIDNTSLNQVLMTGGKIYVVGKSYVSSYGIKNTSGKVKISGNAIITADEYSPTILVYNDGTGVIDITGGTISSPDGYAVYNNSTEIINISGGTISTDNSYAAVHNNNVGTVNISGGTISQTDVSATAVYNKSTGTINITGGVISSQKYKAIGNHSSGTINISNTTLDNSKYGISQYGEGIINILENVTINASDIAIENETTGTINIGIQDGVVSVVDPVITGTNYGVYNYDEGNINFYDGIITGPTNLSIYGTVTTEENYKVRKTQNDDGTESATLEFEGVEERAIVLGGINYPDLQSAVNAASDSEESVMTLYRNIELTDNVTVPSTKNIKLYLNGYTITYNGYTISGEGSFTVEGDTNQTSLTAAIMNIFTGNTEDGMNVIAYEMNDGSNLSILNTYELQVYNDNKYEKVNVENEINNVGRYSITNKTSDTKMTTINGKLFLNNLSEGNYKIVDNNGKELIFTISEDGTLSGNIKENYTQNLNRIMSTAQAELIVSLQTGQKVIRYGILVGIISTMLGLLILLRRQIIFKNSLKEI